MNVFANTLASRVFWNVRKTYQEKYFYFIINPQSRIYESIKPGCMFVCFRTFCFISVKLKHEYGTTEDWKASQTNTDTVKRQRRGQGAWPRDVGGDSASSAGERPQGTFQTQSPTAGHIPASLRARTRDHWVSTRLQHGRKHTHSADRPARGIRWETRKGRSSERGGGRQVKCQKVFAVSLLTRRCALFQLRGWPRVAPPPSAS